MRISYPRSFLKLLLIGFALAMLPLLFAFINAAVYLDRLAEQSRNTVTQSVQATRASRELMENLNLMERSARQYFVLHDKQLLDNLSHAHEQFGISLHALQQLGISRQQRENLGKLENRADSLYQEIMQVEPDKAVAASSISQFLQIAEFSQTILLEINKQIDLESSKLAVTAESTQRMLISQTITLLPVALIVAAVITFLVAQPIRRMDAAIKRLGEGDYQEPISIDGPGDLRALGERLNWLRSQLDGLEQQKQRFLRHVSHELKTPLTAIREGSELLSEEIGGALNPQQKEITGILRESSLRLQKMIENLLNYSAVQHQPPALKLTTNDMGQLLEEVISSYALTLSSKQIHLNRELHACTLQADREKLHTIIDNLVSNAIKYTPAGGSILLKTWTDNTHAIFEIHDGGPGVMAADRARLFDPFYKGNGIYESLVSGSGLGLSIAKEYVDAHGGEITLLASDQGAHFRISLPIQLQPEKVQA